MSSTDTPPVWFHFSHHDRYRWFKIVRHKWCRCPILNTVDIAGRTVYLDGRWITDIPSFYLSLGEAVNGPGGYFGGCLDSLADCFCGGFGVRFPLTIYLSHYEKVRAVLDGRAWCRYRAESFYDARNEDLDDLIGWGYLGDGSPEDIVRWQGIYEAALSGELLECDECDGSYFDCIVEVLTRYHSSIVPASEADEYAKETQ